MLLLKDRLINVNDNQTATFVMDLKLSENITKTKDGYLLCKNSIFGRTGFQTYRGRELVGMGFGDDELVEVLRDEKDVFNQDSLETFVGKPVTLGHPNVDVTVDNFKELGKGYILGTPKRIGNNVVGDFMITDKETIRLVEENQLRELSLGYQTKLVRDEDKVKQTEIYINHLAIVSNGRAGNARIIDEEMEDNMDKKELLETLANSNGNTINIYFKDEVVETEVVDEEITNEVVDEEVLETEEVVDEVIEEVEVEETEEKEEETEVMTKDALKELLKSMTQEELNEVLGIKDEEVINNVNDEMFNDITQVENTNVETTTLNDYSEFSGNEINEVLQKEYEKFSPRNLNKLGDEQVQRQAVRTYKERQAKDFIK